LDICVNIKGKKSGENIKVITLHFLSYSDYYGMCTSMLYVVNWNKGWCFEYFFVNYHAHHIWLVQKGATVVLIPLTLFCTSSMVSTNIYKKKKEINAYLEKFIFQITKKGRNKFQVYDKDCRCNSRIVCNICSNESFLFNPLNMAGEKVRKKIIWLLFFLTFVFFRAEPFQWSRSLLTIDIVRISNLIRLFSFEKTKIHE
jgi:hypothetical protein